MTSAAATQIGFMLVLILLADLFPTALATCSANVTPPATLTAPRGTIMSDSDGYGAMDYDPPQACTWMIECQAGEVVVITDMDYRVPRPASVDFHHGTSQEKLQSLKDETIGWRWMSPAQKITIAFVATSSAPAARGFTLNYTCMPARCSGVSAPDGKFAGGRTFDEKTGRVVSNSFIFTAGPYDPSTLSETYKNEDCRFTFRCPAGQNYMALWSSFSTLKPGNTLKVDNSTYLSFGMYRQIGFIQRSSSDVLEVDASYTSNAVGSTEGGYEITYVCSPNRCSSVMGDGIVLRNEGNFSTDTDGSGNVAPFPSENCTWTIACDAGVPFAYVSITGKLAADANATIRSRSSKELLLTANGSEVSTREVLDLANGDGSADVHFATSTAVALGGLDFSFICRPSKCSSGPAVVETQSGSLGPTGSSFSGEVCAWEVRCPAEYSGGIVVTWSGNSKGGEVRMNGNGAGDEAGFATVLSSSTSKLGVLGNSTQLFVSYNSTSAGAAFKISWACMAQKATASGFCMSRNVTDAAVGSASGTLSSFSPVVGPRLVSLVSSQPGTPGQECEWTIKCPNASSYIRINPMVFRTSSNQDCGGVEVKPQGESWMSYIGGTPTRPLCPWDGLMAPATFELSELQLRLSVPVASASLKVSGVSLDYDCIDPNNKCQQHDPLVPLTAVNGTIMTDADGAGASYGYRQHELCTWEVRCPAGYKHVELNIQYKMPYIKFPGKESDRFIVSDAQTGAKLISLYSKGTGSQVEVVGSPQLSISWSALGKNSFLTPGGVTMNYTCLTEICFSDNATIIDKRATTVQSGPVTGEPMMIGGGEMCTKIVRCNSSYAAVSVRYSLGKGATLSLGPSLMYDSASPGQFREDSTVFWAGGKLPITLNTRGSSLTSLSAYTADVVCHVSKCLSLTPYELTAPNGTITWGKFGDMSYQTCYWKVTCPPEYTAMSIEVFFRSISNDKVTLGFGTSQMSLRGASQGRKYRAMQGYSAVSVGLKTSHKSIAFSSYEMTTSYRCLTQRCQAESAGMIVNPENQLIESDSDGESSATQSFTGERCSWQIRCPVGQSVSFSTIRGNIGTNKLSVIILANSSVSSSVYREFTGSFTTTKLITPSNSIDLTYNPARVANGFSLRVSCEDFADCGAVERPTPDTVSWSTVGAAKGGESCAVFSACPAGYSHVLLDVQRMTIRTPATATAEYPDWRGQPIILSLTKPSTLIFPQWAQVNVWNIHQSVDAAVNMTCKKSACSVSTEPIEPPTCFGNSTCVPVTVGPKANGKDLGSHASNEECKWSISCRPGYFARTLLRWKTGTVHLSERTVAGTGTTKLYDQELNGTAYFSNWPNPTLEMDFMFFGSEGAWADVSCYPSRCDVDQTVRESKSGSLQFQRPGSSFASNAKCRFSIKCPAGSVSLRVNCSATLPSTANVPQYRVYDYRENDGLEKVMRASGYIRTLESTVYVAVNESNVYVEMESDTPNLALPTKSIPKTAVCDYACEDTAPLTRAPPASTPSPFETRIPPTLPPTGGAPADTETKSVSTGAIVGGAAGGVVFLAIAVGGVVFMSTQIQKRQRAAIDAATAKGGTLSEGLTSISSSSPSSSPSDMYGGGPPAPSDLYSNPRSPKTSATNGDVMMRHMNSTSLY